jgi:multidrug efflux system membrane fusion protein
MSLQKTWVNFHLRAGSAVIAMLLAGCDNSVAQNAAPQAPPSAPLTWW